MKRLREGWIVNSGTEDEENEAGGEVEDSGDNYPEGGKKKKKKDLRCGVGEEEVQRQQKV